MPKKNGKKSAREMTTEEALNRLFSPEAVEELKRLARELDEKKPTRKPKKRSQD